MAIASSQAWSKGDSPGAAPPGKYRLYINNLGTLVIVDDSGTESELSTEDLTELIDKLHDIHIDTNEPNGFIRSQTDTMGVIAFDDNTRTFLHSVSTGMSTFDFYSGGQKYSKNYQESCIIDDITGLHYIYYDSDGYLQHTMSFDKELITTYAIACIVYWNALSHESIVTSDERHGIQMDGITHLLTHSTIGAQYDTMSNGITIMGLAQGTNSYSSITQGKIWDEDIPIEISASSSNVFWYRSGPSGIWNKTFADNRNSYNGGSGMSYWNEWTGTEWVLTRTSSYCYSLTHFVAVPDIALGGKVVKIIGQSTYESRRLAREAIFTEIGKLSLDGLPTPEFVLLYSVITKCDGSLQDLSGNKLYVDFRMDVPGSDGHVPGVTSHVDLTDENLMFITTVSGIHNLSYSDRVVVMKTPGTVILPRTNVIDDDGYMRQFWVKNGSAGPVVIQTTPPEVFTPGNNKIVLNTKNNTAHIGCVYSATGTDSWMNIAEQLNIMQVRRSSIWDAANFSNDTPIPFDVVDKDTNDSVILYNSSSPTLVQTQVYGTAAVSYWAAIDSTGGSTYTVEAFLRKNGITEIPGTRVITGNYGNEDQSLSIGVTHVDIEIGDYFEVVFNQSNLTGRVQSCTLSVNVVC
jgi:hypothetical protein